MEWLIGAGCVLYLIIGMFFAEEWDTAALVWPIFVPIEFIVWLLDRPYRRHRKIAARAWATRPSLYDSLTNEQKAGIMAQCEKPIQPPSQPVDCIG